MSNLDLLICDIYSTYLLKYNSIYILNKDIGNELLLLPIYYETIKYIVSCNIPAQLPILIL